MFINYENSSRNYMLLETATSDKASIFYPGTTDTSTRITLLLIPLISTRCPSGLNLLDLKFASPCIIIQFQ
jgi:hypothetical protein